MSILPELIQPHFHSTGAIELRQSRFPIPEHVLERRKLNQNENPVTHHFREQAWQKGVKKPDLGVLLNTTSYSEPQDPRLLKALGRFYGVAEDHICITSGGDGAIERLTQMFCAPGDAIIVHNPTFFSYEDYASQYGAKTINVPLKENGLHYELDIEGIVQSVRKNKGKVKLVYICNPNNPTGTYFPEDQVVELVNRLREEAVACVVDEAYTKIAGKPSMSRYLEDFENLITIHTVSKELSAAGLRVGMMCCADPEIIKQARAALSFYTVSAPSTELCLEWLDPKYDNAVKNSYGEILDMRAGAIDELNAMGIDVFERDPNAASFFLMRLRDMERTLPALATQGIQVGNPDFFDFKDRVRVSIGLAKDNQAFLRAIKEHCPWELGRR